MSKLSISLQLQFHNSFQHDSFCKSESYDHIYTPNTTRHSTVIQKRAYPNSFSFTPSDPLWAIQISNELFE